MASVVISIILWQMLLTAAIVAISVMHAKDRREILRKHAELDLDHSLNDLKKQLERINLQEHEALRTAVKLFLDRCKRDPITAERRHTDILELEATLNHGRSR